MNLVLKCYSEEFHASKIHCSLDVEGNVILSLGFAVLIKRVCLSVGITAYFRDHSTSSTNKKLQLFSPVGRLALLLHNR
jgi:hypothetical protein